jgi:hypothetical protein
VHNGKTYKIQGNVDNEISVLDWDDFEEMTIKQVKSDVQRKVQRRPLLERDSQNIWKEMKDMIISCNYTDADIIKSKIEEEHRGLSEILAPSYFIKNLDGSWAPKCQIHSRVDFPSAEKYFLTVFQSDFLDQD